MTGTERVITALTADYTASPAGHAVLAAPKRLCARGVSAGLGMSEEVLPTVCELLDRLDIRLGRLRMLMEQTYGQASEES